MDLKYYKIKYGFAETEYCQITSEELPKAYGMFLTQEGNGIFSDGTAIRARDMIRIEPDWHRVRGWNRGYKMQLEDYEDISEKEIKDYKKIQNQAKEIVEFAIKNNRPELITKKLSELLELPELKVIEQKQPEVKRISDDLTNKFRIN